MKKDTCCTSPFLTAPLSDCDMLDEIEDCNTHKILARVYVPWQEPGGKLYSMCEGLERGTIFPCLDQPYACPTSCAVGSEEEVKRMDSKGGCCS